MVAPRGLRNPLLGTIAPAEIDFIIVGNQLADRCQAYDMHRSSLIASLSQRRVAATSAV